MCNFNFLGQAVSEKLSLEKRLGRAGPGRAGPGRAGSGRVTSKMDST